MHDFYIGLITTVAVIGIIEVLPFLEKRLIGALTLVGIAFIYIGFSWHDTLSLILSILGVAVFLALGYFGYQKNFLLVVAGLVLHGLWDLTFPLFSQSAPHGLWCVLFDD